jgi:hypothetical protein
MNIFIVDRHPIVAAQMLCDQHVVKMYTESIQMLSTCHRVLDGKMEMALSNSGKRKVPRYRLPDGRDKVLYHAVHFNHPCNIWIRQDVLHYEWLFLHTVTLESEYKKRFRNKSHACDFVLRRIADRGPPQNIPNLDHTYGTTSKVYKLNSFVQAMPDEYKDEDPVKAYRNFYIGSKSKFARWNYTTPPKWYTDATSKSVRSVSALRSNQKSLSDDLRLF